MMLDATQIKVPAIYARQVFASIVPLSQLEVGRNLRHFSSSFPHVSLDISDDIISDNL